MMHSAGPLHGRRDYVIAQCSRKTSGASGIVVPAHSLRLLHSLRQVTVDSGKPSGPVEDAWNEDQSQYYQQPAEQWSGNTIYYNTAKEAKIGTGMIRLGNASFLACYLASFSDIARGPGGSKGRSGGETGEEGTVDSKLR